MKLCEIFTEDELTKFYELMNNNLKEIELLFVHNISIPEDTQNLIDIYNYLYNFVYSPYTNYRYNELGEGDYFLVFTIFDLINLCYYDDFTDSNSLTFFFKLKTLYYLLNKEG